MFIASQVTNSGWTMCTPIAVAVFTLSAESSMLLAPTSFAVKVSVCPASVESSAESWTVLSPMTGANGAIAGCLGALGIHAARDYLVHVVRGDPVGDDRLLRRRQRGALVHPLGVDAARLRRRADEARVREHRRQHVRVRLKEARTDAALRAVARAAGRLEERLDVRGEERLHVGRRDVGHRQARVPGTAAAATDTTTACPLLALVRRLTVQPDRTQAARTEEHHSHKQVKGSQHREPRRCEDHARAGSNDDLAPKPV